MRTLRRTRLEPGAAAPTPVETRPFPALDLPEIDEQPAANPPTPAPDLSSAKPLPRITLQLPAIDPDDLSSTSLHLRDSFARLPRCASKTSRGCRERRCACPRC